MEAESVRAWAGDLLAFGAHEAFRNRGLALVRLTATFDSDKSRVLRAGLWHD